MIEASSRIGKGLILTTAAAGATGVVAPEAFGSSTPVESAAYHTTFDFKQTTFSPDPVISSVELTPFMAQNTEQAPTAQEASKARTMAANCAKTAFRNTVRTKDIKTKYTPTYKHPTHVKGTLRKVKSSQSADCTALGRIEKIEQRGGAIRKGDKNTRHIKRITAWVTDVNLTKPNEKLKSSYHRTMPISKKLVKKLVGFPSRYNPAEQVRLTWRPTKAAKTRYNLHNITGMAGGASSSSSTSGGSHESGSGGNSSSSTSVRQHTLSNIAKHCDVHEAAGFGNSTERHTKGLKVTVSAESGKAIWTWQLIKSEANLGFVGLEADLVDYSGSSVYPKETTEAVEPTTITSTGGTFVSPYPLNSTKYIDGVTVCAEDLEK